MWGFPVSQLLPLVALSLQVQAHVWVRGGCDGNKCDRCQKKIKSFQSLTGITCAWCHQTVSSYFTGLLHMWYSGLRAWIVFTVHTIPNAEVTAL